MPWASALRRFVVLFEAAGGEAFGDLSVEGDVDDDHRDGDDGEGGEEQAVVGDVAAGEREESGGDGFEFVVLDVEEGEEELVPAGEGGEDRDGGEAWSQEGHGDHAEDAEVSGAVDAGGFEEFFGDRVEEHFEEVGGQGESHGGVGDDEGPVGVGEAEVGEDRALGDEVGLQRQDEAEGEQSEQEFGSAEAVAAEREGGGGGEREDREYRYRGHDGAVEGVAADVADFPGLRPDREVERGGQGERGGEDLGVAFEAGEHHPYERDEEDERERGEAHVDEASAKADGGVHRTTSRVGTDAVSAGSGCATVFRAVFRVVFRADLREGRSSPRRRMAVAMRPMVTTTAVRTTAMAEP